jgi:hypothetical protein
MPFDRQAEYRAQLEHLVALAQTPGWKRHAWDRAQFWDAEQSGLFAGIAADLRREMLARAGPAKPSEPGDPTPTKPG